MRRLVIAAAVGAAAVASAVPSFAESTSPTQSSPVGVSVSTDGGIFVNTTINNNPGLSVAVAGGQACVGFSLEVPFCEPLPGVSVTALPRDITVGPASVHLDTSDGVGVGTSLGGQPLAYASVANGWACIGFSEEIPFCYPLNQTNRAVAGI